MALTFVWKQNRYPKCRDSRECFARQCGKCSILNETYKEDGDCKFCKPYGNVTNGRIYPWDKDYSQSLKKAKQLMSKGLCKKGGNTDL